MPLNIGAFLGGNRGQGGIVDPLQAVLAKHQERQKEKAIIDALQQYSAGQQPAAPPIPGASQPAAPPGPNMAGAAPPPISGGSRQASPVIPPPQPGGFAGGMPDLGTMIGLLSKSGISPDQQFEALKSYGAFASPFEKMLQQLEVKQLQMDNQRNMLDARLQEMRDIAAMRDLTQRRGQDIGASNTALRVGATERGQDIRADTAADEQAIQQQRADTQERGTNSRIIQGEEGLKIKQQQADTASDRAGTYKYGTMERTRLAGEKQKETERLDSAKIKKMETATSAENKKPFQAARDQYNRAAALYQSLTRPGATPAANPDDIAFAKQKMDEAANNMVRLSTASNAPSSGAGLIKPTPGEEVRTDGQGNYFVLRDGKPTPAEPPAGQ